MSSYGERYQIVPQPDSRGIVIDAQDESHRLFGPASIEACHMEAKRLNDDQASRDWDAIQIAERRGRSR